MRYRVPVRVAPLTDLEDSPNAQPYPLRGSAPTLQQGYVDGTLETWDIKDGSIFPIDIADDTLGPADIGSLTSNELQNNSISGGHVVAERSTASTSRT